MFYVRADPPIIFPTTMDGCLCWIVLPLHSSSAQLGLKMEKKCNEYLICVQVVVAKNIEKYWF